MKSSRKQSQESSAFQIVSAESKRDVKRFIVFQYELYKNDPNFVPPLRMDMRSILSGQGSVLFKKGKYKLFIALKDNKTVGRIAAGIDEQIKGRISPFIQKSASLIIFSCDRWVSTSNETLSWDCPSF